MHREYSDPEVLRNIRRRSLAKLRKEIEPVDPPILARFLGHWHNLKKPRAGLDALLDAIEKLQGAAIPASILETEVLRSRVANYQPSDLDSLLAAGEVIWCGIEPIGERDGRVALYLTDHLARLWEPPTVTLDERETKIFDFLQARGASFFAAIHQEQGFPGDTTDALWSLVWKGVITNDAFRPLRARLRGQSEKRSKRGFRSRRQASGASEGRWSLVASRIVQTHTQTERAVALAEQLLQRYGVVTREVATSEGIRGGFSAVYDVFKSLEDSGRIRRGYFVSGVGAMQFALPHVLEQLRALRETPDLPEVVHLAATDPANPYGALLKWPVKSLQRSAGAMVILVDGVLGAYMTRGGRQLQVFLPEGEPDQTRMARAVAARLKLLASAKERQGLMIAEINGEHVEDHALTPHLRDVGFLRSPQGYYLPTRAREPVPALEPEREEELEELDA